MTFYWQLDTRGIQWIQYAGIIGAICGVPLAPQFNRWFDKKWTVIVGVSVGALTDTVPVLLKLLDAMPHDPTTLVYILVGLSSLGSFFGVQASITVASMMGDVADEHELKHGTRQEGVYFGSYSFSQKCTGALGNFMAGVAIDLIGLNPLSKVGEVPQNVLTHFGASYGLIALLIAAAIWVFLPYSLNSKRHAQVLVELAKRRPADAVAVSGMPHAEAPAPAPGG
jgi:Na+/melibiose symporter-like transporter